MMNFGFPLALFLLFFLAPLCFFVFKAKSQQDHILHPFLMHHLVVQMPPIRRYLRALFLLSSCTCAILALAQPINNPHYPKQNEKLENRLIQSLKERKVHEVLFVIDTSLSMSLTDTRQGISRLDLAKEIADTVIQGLNGESVSLIAMTSTPTFLAPTTHDYLFTRLILKDVHYNEGDIGGTDFISLFHALTDLFEKKPLDKKVSIVLLSDGGDTLLDATGRDQTIFQAMNDSYRLNYQIYCVGIGSMDKIPIKDLLYKGEQVYAPLQAAILQQIAKQGRGLYIDSWKRTTESISAELIQALQSVPALTEQYEILRRARGGSETLLYDHLFQIPLFIGISALLGALLLDRKKMALMLLFFPCFLSGIDPNDYAESQEFEQAKSLYEYALTNNSDPWKLAVLHYNYGTSLLNQGAYDEALGEFNQVLKIKNISPVLAGRTQYNRSLAMMALAKKMYEQKEVDANQMHQLLETAQEMIDESIEAHCLADQYKGKNTCETSMEAAILEQINHLLKEIPMVHFDEKQQVSEEYQRLYRLLIQKSITPKEMQSLISISSSSLLLDAQKALNMKQIKRAKFYLRARLFQLNPLVAMENPQETLKILIESEQRAIDQNVELQEIERKEGLLASDPLFVLEQQKQTNALASQFVKAVRLDQEKQYKEKGACLKFPWANLLPLFFDGYRAALSAEGHLSKELGQKISQEHAFLIPGLIKQNEALSYWEKALKAFHSQNENEESSKQSRAAEVSQLMQSIVEMHTEDAHSASEAQDQAKQRNGEVEKPW